MRITIEAAQACRWVQEGAVLAAGVCTHSCDHANCRQDRPVCMQPDIASGCVMHMHLVIFSHPPCMHD